MKIFDRELTGKSAKNIYVLQVNVTATKVSLLPYSTLLTLTLPIMCLCYTPVRHTRRAAHALGDKN